MIVERYQIRFNTPAFLGNAEQSAQWRTPPIKALLRQWWRVVYGADHSFAVKVEEMRREEGLLFGNAWLKDNESTLHRKSRIAMRLTPWSGGKLTSQDWPGCEMAPVITTSNDRATVRSDLYLGYGPVMPPSRRENRRGITIRGAIGIDQEAILSLLPERIGGPSEQDMRDIHDAVQLMAWFGTLGSRSRNGWGSLAMSAESETPVLTNIPDKTDTLLGRIGREWTDCLELDWPHALGYSDGRPLIWVTKNPEENWCKVMGSLANIRVQVRHVAKSFIGPDNIGGIHLLGYPAGGKWSLRQFSNGQPTREDPEGRLATQLRFKVVKTPKGLVGMVFHMPHRMPDTLMKRLSPEQQSWIRKHERQVWEKIHQYLNQNNRLVLL